MTVGERVELKADLKAEMKAARDSKKVEMKASWLRRGLHTRLNKGLR